MPTSTEPRLRRLGALLCAALAGATLLSACDEAAVTHPPTATATPFVLNSLPPIGFNHRYGNNPVAAADAFALERSLYARKQFWEVGLRADPAETGYVDETDPAAAKAARAKFTDVQLIIASESLPTLRDMLRQNDDGQKAYCEQIIEQLRADGYTGLRSVGLLVFFGESHRHANLVWTQKDGYTYTVYDNNLNGALLTPIPTTTPFTTPPPH